MDSLVRHRRSKVAATDRLILTVQLPVLYSTLNYDKHCKLEIYILKCNDDKA